MSERIMSMPSQTSGTCVQLPGREIELVRGEMANTSGGSILPEGDPAELLEDIIDYINDVVDDVDDIIDDIKETVSEWWDSW